jgi:hypothetical protein
MRPVPLLVLADVPADPTSSGWVWAVVIGAIVVAVVVIVVLVARRRP